MAYKNLLELLRERDRKSSPLPGNDYDLAADLTHRNPQNTQYNGRSRNSRYIG